MAIDHKRKDSPEAESAGERPTQKLRSDSLETNAAKFEQKEPTSDASASPTTASTTNETASSAPQTNQERLQARFKALQARQVESRNLNRKAAAAESKRLATDQSQLTSLNRKHAIASHKLLKADTEAEGEDFERKRAWDWTVDEAEKWDKRMDKKEKHRNDVAFQDYRQDARKVYKRQMRALGKPDLDEYEKEKADAVEKAARDGKLDLVEMEDGELVAIDKEGSFYSTNESTSFADNKPTKAAVDRLVADFKKAEDVRMKKRKDRRGDEDEADISSINEKNKVRIPGPDFRIRKSPKFVPSRANTLNNQQFNQKLARFYNKYTSDIRDSFERGTAI